MKIAFIIPSLANRGPILMVRDLVNYLISKDHICHVYYFDDIKELDFSCPTTQISFFKKINFKEYDIIHSHLFRPDLYCAIYKRSLHKSLAKVITTVHTAIYDDLKYTYGKMISPMLIPIWTAIWKRMDHVVVLTNFAKTYYKKIKLKNLTVINNGRDIPQETLPISQLDIDLIETFKQGHKLLGTICALDKRKGLEQIISLLQLKKEYVFLVVGDGSERIVLEELALTYGVESRFKVIGFRENGFRYLTHFDLFVMPSRSEGMPLALLEAMAAKIPIVCANIPAISSELSDQEVGFFELDEIESLKSACEKIVYNSKEKVDHAFNHYMKSYTVAKMGANYIDLYHSLK